MSLSPKDITLLICGRLHMAAIENISYYLSKDLNVIYSTWKPQNDKEKEILDKLTTVLPDNNIIVSEYMDVSTFDNIHNVYYQAWTWAEAARICTTSHCIKMRTDLKFDNIDPLINTLIENPNKITCISAFFRPSYVYMYCASDFVIGCTSIDARGITKRLLTFLRYNLFTRNGHIPPERKICTATLLQKGLDMNSLIPENVRKHMMDNYVIVDVNTLKPTMHWHGVGPFTYFTHHTDISITSIADV